MFTNFGSNHCAYVYKCRATAHSILSENLAIVGKRAQFLQNIVFKRFRFAYFCPDPEEGFRNPVQSRGADKPTAAADRLPRRDRQTATPPRAGERHRSHRSGALHARILSRGRPSQRSARGGFVQQETAFCSIPAAAYLHPMLHGYQ